MENQSRQQQSSELSTSALAQASPHPGQAVGGLKSLIELLKRYPWLIWGGMWAFLVALSAISIISLTHTGPVEQQKPAPTPVATEKPPASSSHTSSSIYLWLLGAAALTCGAGSLLIYKRLKSSSLCDKLPNPLKSSSERSLTRRQRRKRMFQENPPLPTPLEEPQPPAQPVPAEIEPVVTVLPPEESHPLDAEEESLAEMMDIRKQRSLSSILRDP